MPQLCAVEFCSPSNPPPEELSNPIQDGLWRATELHPCAVDSRLAAQYVGGDRLGAWQLHANGARTWTVIVSDARGKLELGRATWSTHVERSLLFLRVVTERERQRRKGAFGVVQLLICNDGAMTSVLDVAVPGDLDAVPFRPPRTGWITESDSFGALGAKNGLAAISWNGYESEIKVATLGKDWILQNVHYGVSPIERFHDSAIEGKPMSAWPNAVIQVELRCD